MRLLPRDRGAILIETAIVFPFFLFGILFFMWIGITLNAKSALTTAGSRAIRLALTRGDNELSPDFPGIVELEDWLGSHGNDEGPRIAKFFSSDGQLGPALGYYHDTSIATAFHSEPELHELPPMYAYSLVYLYEYLKQSIGPTLKYPCDPSLPDDEMAGAGCISCVFLNPENASLPTDPDHPDTFSGTNYPSDRMGFECKYQPATYLLKPIISLLSYMGGEMYLPKMIFKRRIFLIK